MLEKKRGCCEKCKGTFSKYFLSGWLITVIFQLIKYLAFSSECTYEGEKYLSGAEWSTKDDPCANLKCVAGVVTASNLQCYTPCDKPTPARPGQCCPTCFGK